MIKESKLAIFNFNEIDKSLIHELSKYIDDNYQKIYDFFEVPVSKEKVKINIIPTKQEFDTLYVKFHNLPQDTVVPKWVVGTCDRGQINYLSITDYKNTDHAFPKKDYDKALDSFKKTIVHEYVHFVNDIFNKVHKCKESDKYLVEGIATYLSEQYTQISPLFANTLDEFINKTCYHDYYLVTKYLVENYDKKLILQLFQSKELAHNFLTKDLFQKIKDHYSTFQKGV